MLRDDIKRDRDEAVELLLKAEDSPEARRWKAYIAKLDLLDTLLEAWIDEKLVDLKILTTKQIILDIEESRGARLDNLRLMQGLIEAWHDDRLSGVPFRIRIGE